MEELKVINPNREKVKEETNKKEVKTNKYKKLKLYSTFLSLIVTSSLYANKVNKDMSERAKVLSENKTFTSLLITKGSTIESIAKDLYKDYPEDKKVYISLNDLKEEIVKMNGLSNPDKIIEGNYLIVPYYLNEKTK